MVNIKRYDDGKCCNDMMINFIMIWYNDGKYDDGKYYNNGKC